MSIVTFIIKNVTIQGSTSAAYQQIKNDLKTMQSNGEVKLIDDSIAQINLMTNHKTFAILVNRCVSNQLDYVFTISETEPLYSGHDSGVLRH